MSFVGRNEKVDVVAIHNYLWKVSDLVADSNYFGKAGRMSQPRHSAQRQAWYQSLRAHSAVMEVFERELHDECGISLAWYDVISCLYLAPKHAMRMCDLAEEVLMSRSWLTRRIDQLVKAGLVERHDAAADGRGVEAKLTREGRRVFIGLERSHGASIDRHFSTLMTLDEARVIGTAMARVEQSARKTLGYAADTG